MTYRKLSLTFLFLALLIPSIATAHDPSKHKGKGTKGEIVSITGDLIELKTSAGAQTVTINEKTKFERGNDQLYKADLKKGDQVTVFGTKLATGELVAREILLASPEHHADHKENKQLADRYVTMFGTPSLYQAKEIGLIESVMSGALSVLRAGWLRKTQLCNSLREIETPYGSR